MNPNREVDKAIAEQASQWVTVLHRKASRQELAEFAEWVKTSPRHIRDFLLMVAIERELRQVDPEGRYGLHEAAEGPAFNVIPLQERTGRSPKKATDGNWQSRRRFTWSLAAATACTMLLVWMLVPILLPGQTFATAVGEQRAIELSDGSVIHLNTRSRVEIHLSDTARDIRLLEGEALFKVAHDTTRPFRVYADDAVIQAVGTQFNVYRRPQGTTVAVLEGRVRISADEPPEERPTSTSAPTVASTTESPELAAGEVARIDHNGQISQPATADVERIVAWRQRRLAFQSDSLADIVEEFNRYNRQPRFRLEGSSVAQRHYTGVFDADDPESLVQLLSMERDLVVERHSGEVVVRTRE